MFHRKFISLVLGSAIAVTSLSATSARAQGPYVQHNQRQMQGNEAVAAALAGVAALFIIGKTIERNNKGRDKATRPHQPEVQHRPHKPHKTHRPHKSHRQPHAYDRGHSGHRHNQHGGHRTHAHGGHGGHAHWHRHGNMKHIHRHGPRHHHHRHH